MRCTTRLGFRRSALGCAILGTLFTLMAPAAQAGTMTFSSPAATNLWSGSGLSGNKFDIVIVAEGYTSSQMSLFASNATAVKNAFLALEPYKTYASFIRIWRVNSISSQSGIDHPGSNVWKNTCFDSRYIDAPGDVPGQGRLIAAMSTTNLNIAKAKVSGADLVVVICNDPQYGGGGVPGGESTTYNGAQMKYIVTHESGHSATNLADEYFSANLTYTGAEPTSPNATTNPSSVTCKWSAWSGTILPGSYDLVSTWQGGSTQYSSGVYRPVNFACHMKDQWNYGFCPVCREAVIRMLYSKTDAITASSWSTYYASGSYQNTGTFTATFDEIVPNATTYVVWQVDGYSYSSTTSFAAGQGVRYRLSKNLAKGWHTVTGWVIDTSTWNRIGGPSNRPSRSVTRYFYQW